MTKVVGVRFRNVGKIYYFSPKNYEIKTGDHVIVETARGIEYGKVVLAPREVSDDSVVHPLKEVLRVATKDDDERESQNRSKERDAFKICQKKIREHGLEMKRLMQNILLTIIRYCFILLQMAVSIFDSWLRIWHLFLKHVLSFAR